MTNLKILQFNLGRTSRDSANGVDKTVYYLSKHLGLLGSHVTVYDIVSEKSYLKGWPLEKNVTFKPFPKNRARVISAKLINDIIRNRKNIDFAHLHSVFIPEMAQIAFLMKMLKIPYCVTPNGGYSPITINDKRWKKTTYLGFIEQFMLKGAAFIHVLSENERGAVEQIARPKKIAIIPNGVDFEDIPTTFGDSFLEKLWPGAKGRKKIVFLGRLDIFHKGLDLLIEGFEKYIKGGAKTQVVLILIGPDYQGSRLIINKMIERHGLSKSIFVADAIYGQNKWAALADADYFVHTSRFEGMPFSVIEALSLGKPCILTSATNLENAVTLGHAGVLVEQTPGSIKDGISTILSMNAQVLSENAKQYVLNNLHWASIAKEMQLQYLQATKERK